MEAQAIEPLAGLSKANEYLTFSIGGSSYAIDILSVQEIRGYTEPTRIAHSVRHLLGIINLRGAIVSILDLRSMLGAAARPFNSETVVIVISLHGKVFGVVVDAVNDVVQLSRNSLKPAPEVGSEVDARYIGAIATLDDRLLMLLDIATLFGDLSLTVTPA